MTKLAPLILTREPSMTSMTGKFLHTKHSLHDMFPYNFKHLLLNTLFFFKICLCPLSHLKQYLPDEIIIMFQGEKQD